MQNKKSLFIIKLALLLVSFLLVICGFVLSPKEILNSKDIYDISISVAETDNKNIVLCDYKVFGTKSRFNDFLENGIDEVLDGYKERKEVLVVKIPEYEYTSTRDDFILIKDKNVPELNVEFYIAQNVNIASYELPTKTFISVVSNVMNKANRIFVLAEVGLLLIVDIPLGYAIVKNILSYKKEEGIMKEKID